MNLINNTFNIIDSYKSQISFYSQNYEILCKYLRLDYSIVNKPKIFLQNVEQQSNGYDCGLYLINNILTRSSINFIKKTRVTILNKYWN